MKSLCRDCQKEVTEHSIRCKSCSNKNRVGKFTWNVESKINRLNENNPNWKGDKVKYGALHDWVKRRKTKKLFCEECKINKSAHLANISQKYYRDINDYRWLCNSCHRKEHGRLKRLMEAKTNDIKMH